MACCHEIHHHCRDGRREFIAWLVSWAAIGLTLFFLSSNAPLPALVCGVGAWVARKLMDTQRGCER